VEKVSNIHSREIGNSTFQWKREKVVQHSNSIEKKAFNIPIAERKIF
jgi:hypothetical protein